jgi:hypothetical protein
MHAICQIVFVNFFNNPIVTAVLRSVFEMVMEDETSVSARESFGLF